MPPSVSPFGNLYAYKLYTLPTAKRLFGSYSFRRKSTIKHHANVQRMLEILALNGPMTTWNMAKVVYQNDVSSIRTKEKEYRRLLKGRSDRGKQSPGVLDIGLVVIDSKSYNHGPSDVYRLSIPGILYCIEVLDLTHKEIDSMAKNHATVMPWVFGRWEYLKSIIGSDVYRLKTLASGTFLDNIQITKLSKFPIFELLTYLSIKYQENFEYIDEKDLADQVSCWFYTHLLIPSNTKEKSNPQNNKLKKILDGDKDLKRWYYQFVEEAIRFYEQRFKTIKKLEKI